MKVAVVGPRQGADTEVVADFCRALHQQDPSVVLISGGAKGVDQIAESTWQQLGGLVWSYRAHQRDPDTWGVDKWVYGGEEQATRASLHGHPTFADPVSALKYRSILVVEDCDRLVAFEGKLSMYGTAFTIAIAHESYHRPVHVWNGTWREL